MSIFNRGTIDVPTPPQPVPDANAPARGVDVSHHNGSVDWNAVAAAGISFCFLKATEGVDFVDPTFKNNVVEAKAAGLLVGAYHFFHAGDAPSDQSDLFLKTIDGVQLDLPPVLDWEQGDPNPNQASLAEVWLQNVAKKTGKTPIIYSYSAFLEGLKLDSRWRVFPLWIASYEPSPHIILPWVTYLFWQTSESGTLPGVRGGFDTDVFNGSLTDLRALLSS